ncbi:putative TMhelix containing protein II [Vibrio phage VPMCC14]|nr:putative TMhelix containing protein II [Vibrio phage VPMCC14]
MPTWITGILTGGFSFLSEWWKGKQEQAKQELAIEQAKVETLNQIKLKQVVGEIENDGISIRQMETSWKDEWFLILFSLPLIAMFLSPFIDLFFIEGGYREGILGEAAMVALKNLDACPDWYTYIVTVMVMVSYGYRKGIDKLFSLMKRGK